ncbi:oleuropein beta-glucosidase-like [Henckelia pumila]|uniref:oleuropein beta-glucosidase-like n=1 Tax=Henckelia pumila TaxID=405737 RepID=UPI003C6DF5B0
MAENQSNALALIGNGDNTLSLVQRPTSESRLARLSASKITSQDFPDDFVFGAGTAALQVEGAYAEGGKSLSNWDTFALRTPSKISDGSNPSRAVDEYHRYKEDVLLLKKIGLSAFRFSISWSRVLPGGRLSTGKNMEGIKYYNDLIDFCLCQGIEPYATLLHFEVPQSLEDEYGGFLSEKIVKDFVEFAELCFFEFGDRVKHWGSLNEPFAFTTNGYVYGAFPPGHTGDSQTPPSDGTEPYIVGHNLILAHAYAVDTYRRNYQAVQGGKIGMTNVSSWYEPYDDHSDSEDWKAVLRAFDFVVGWFVEPLVTGDYPASMRKYVGDRLPKFTEAQASLVKGSYDFMGFNYYTARYIKNDPNPTTKSQYAADLHYTSSTTNSAGHTMGPAASSAAPYVIVVPYGIQKVLAFLKNKYGDPLIYITENGCPDDVRKKSVSEAIVDETRVKYIQDHLYYVKKAIDEDKVRVQGYFVWSLMDTFELAVGYTVGYGLFHVDFANGLTRYPRTSAIWLMNFFSQKLITADSKKRARDVEDAGNDGLPKKHK